MNDRYVPDICVHIDIPEIETKISSARIVFHIARLGENVDPAKQVEVLMPFQVLMSMAQSLPKVLEDMHAMGASNTIFGGGGRPDESGSAPN